MPLTVVAMLLLKVSLLLAAVLVIARLMRRAPASAHHRLWSVAFAALLALPLLGAALPEVAIRMPAWAAASAAPAPRAVVDLPVAPPRAAPPASPAPQVAAFGQAEQETAASAPSRIT